MSAFDAQLMFSNAQALAVDGDCTTTLTINGTTAKGLAARVILTDTSAAQNTVKVTVKVSDDDATWRTAAEATLVVPASGTLEGYIPFIAPEKKVKLYYDLTGALKATAGLVQNVGKLSNSHIITFS